MSTGTAAAGTDLPTGTWRIDPMHSSVGFSVGHLMSKVRGSFREVDGQIHIGGDVSNCTVTVSIAMASVGTEQRDDDLRSAHFFDVDAHPDMTFQSTAIEDAGDGAFTVVGDLTIHGITREVRLDADFLGFDATGLQGEPRIGFTARTTVRRSDYEIGEGAIEGSKVVVGDAVTVELDVEAYLESAAAS